MKKILLSSSLFIVFGFYVLITTSRSLSLVTSAESPNGTGKTPSAPSTGGTTPTTQRSPAPTPPPTTKPPITEPVPTPTPTPAPTPTPSPSPAPAPTGAFKNGTWTGSVADAYYGMVQVEAVVSGGKISDVKFLQYPSDRQTSVYINQQAMPYLIQEAVQAQSAQVDTVSGASETSRAFRESLGAALAQAKA